MQPRSTSRTESVQPQSSHVLPAIDKMTHSAATNDKLMMPGDRSQSAAASDPAKRSEPVWDVQDILAERSSLTGENEVLVVWKSSWEPVSNVKRGPAMMRFRDTRTWQFTSRTGGMRVMLPVERGTTLAVDRAVAQEMAKHPKSDDKQTAAASAIGPRKTLGCKAKRRRDDAAADSASTASSH
jgi:hypothetical protein